MMRWISCAGATAILYLAAGAAQAGEFFGGLYSHDISDRISLGGFAKGAQLVGGVRTAPVEELPWLFSPRVHLLAGVNTAGGTNYAAAGFSWRRMARGYADVYAAVAAASGLRRTA